MRFVVFVAMLGASAPSLATAQGRQAAAPQRPAPATADVDRAAQAYEQFLRAHLLEGDDVDGAIAAYRKAAAFDPASATIHADLADLFMREGRANDALQSAEQALRLARPQKRWN